MAVSWIAPATSPLTRINPAGDRRNSRLLSDFRPRHPAKPQGRHSWLCVTCTDTTLWLVIPAQAGMTSRTGGRHLVASRADGVGIHSPEQRAKAEMTALQVDMLSRDGDPLPGLGFSRLP
jgi:hypothetical protein